MTGRKLFFESPVINRSVILTEVTRWAIKEASLLGVDVFLVFKSLNKTIELQKLFTDNKIYSTTTKTELVQSEGSPTVKLTITSTDANKNFFNEKGIFIMCYPTDEVITKVGFSDESTILCVYETGDCHIEKWKNDNEAIRFDLK